MASVLPIQANPLSPPASGDRTAPPRYKFRARFRKSGDLRLVSHHDLMHVCERLFRRADLRLPVSQGFNPRPRMWFALSLALGVAGLNEILELELTEPLSAGEVQARLAAHAPPGLEFLSVKAIDARSSARVRRAWYRLPLPEPIANLAERCQEFLDRPDCWMERRRPHPRRINVRPFVDELHAFADRIEAALWITPNGAARPEELFCALGLSALLDAGTVIERTDLEVVDELPAGTAEAPVITSALEEINGNDAEPPSERPRAIFDNPMSFES